MPEFIKTNSEVIKTTGSTVGNIVAAGKNISDAVNSAKKVNAEVKNLEEIRKKIKTKSPLFNKAKPSADNNTSLDSSQLDAINKSLSNKKRGNGFEIY